jgi:zinc transport system substrate-binding protein
MITHYIFANQMRIKIFRWRPWFVLAAVSGAACWSSLSAVRGAEPLRVVTSFYPVYVAALNVTADVEGVAVSNLTSPHIGCLHDYQLTAGDARQLAQADVLLANGAGMEPFLDKVRRQSPDLRVVEVSEGIPLMDGNAHVWVSFDGARRQADTIASALGALAPDRAEAFRAKAAAYKSKLDALEERMRAALAPHAGTPIVTFHGAFPYFARDFQLEIAGVIEREPGTEPSARELADTVKLVRERGVKALFAEPQFPDQSARVIAAETGARVYELDPVVTGPSDPEAARGAWLAAMEKNLAVLQDALR